MKLKFWFKSKFITSTTNTLSMKPTRIEGLVTDDDSIIQNTYNNGPVDQNYTIGRNQ